MPLHDAVEVNWKYGATTNQDTGTRVYYLCGVRLMIVSS